MSEEDKGWNERRFYSLNLNPADKKMSETNEPESYLPNPKTNPARYGDEPEEPVKLNAPLSERPTPANPSTAPSGSVAQEGPPKPPQQSTPLAPPVTPTEPAP